MRVSVVIPTYNRARVVAESIESVLSQTRPADEIIVVDDGSTDDTQTVLAGYGDRIRTIHQKNAGVSAARNTGIRAATCEWIALQDSDDEWAPEKLQVQVEQLTAHPEAVGHTTNLLFCTPGHPDVNLFSLRGFEMSDDEPLYLQRPLHQALAGLFPPPSTMMRKSAMLEVGLFDETMSIYEDFDLITRVALLGPWVMEKRSLATAYRKTDSAQSLSAQHLSSPLDASRSGVVTYQKLLRSQELTRSERSRCKRGLSGAHFMLGCVYGDQGERRRSLQEFGASLRASPTPKAFIKAGLAVCGGARGRDAIRNRNRNKGQHFRRSEVSASAKPMANELGSMSGEVLK